MSGRKSHRCRQYFWNRLCISLFFAESLLSRTQYRYAPSKFFCLAHIASIFIIRRSVDLLPVKLIVSFNSVRIFSRVGKIFLIPYISATVRLITHLSKSSRLCLPIRCFFGALRTGLRCSFCNRYRVRSGNPVKSLARSMGRLNGGDETPFLASDLQFFIGRGYLQLTVNSQKTLKWLFTVDCQ